MPTVSVVIPTYNRAAFLAQAIRSVLAQTYTDFEVIVVDDGSADDTAAVVRSFDDARVRYLYQTNSERSVARNRGLEAAKGIYLAFLDDDDRYLPHKLACQAAFLETNPDADLVASGAQWVDEQGAVLDTWRPWQVQPELTLLSCLYSCRLLTSTVLFRRQVLERLDHWFDPGVIPVEDTDFFIRILYAGCRMAWLPEVVSVYRLHSANSPGRAVGYMRRYRKILDKLFARSDVPEDVLAEKTRIYDHGHVVAACGAYAYRQVNSAQFNLLRAMMLDPEVVEDSLPAVVARFAGLAGANPQPYIDFVFDHLPAPLAHLGRYRSEVLALST